jgi:hypothetical protein
MLAMADRNGRIWASLPGLAYRARVTVEECAEALAKFESPDKHSRTKENEGRRIEQIDGGWRILNYLKYRSIRDEESIKEAKRKYINTKRHVEKVSTVDLGRHNAEAEAEAEVHPPIPPRSRGGRRISGFEMPEVLRSNAEFVEAWEAWVQDRAARRKKLTPLAAKLQLAKCAAHGPVVAAAVIRRAIERGWTGLYWAEDSAGAPAAPVSADPKSQELRVPEVLRPNDPRALAIFEGYKAAVKNLNDACAKDPSLSFEHPLAVRARQLKREWDTRTGYADPPEDPEWRAYCARIAAKHAPISDDIKKLDDGNTDGWTSTGF